ncbi:MAG: N-glycosylase/DNA lyase [Candidatus Altiarchaeales archaeon]|nr:N-glycosylase/DNA lyase [Candidatus Altiarchaeales archaeon]
MDKLVCELEALKACDIRKKVDKRRAEFKCLGGGNSDALFCELCFCILTANYDALKAIKIQKEVGKGFLKFSEEKLAAKLRELGYRYPNARAKYIVEARKHLKDLGKVCRGECGDPRQWIAENVKGLGYKESSHFLRNIGCGEYAIIDFHILDLLDREGLFDKPKTLSKKKYLEAEERLKKLACECGMDLAELDLYLWYLETGKILK